MWRHEILSIIRITALLVACIQFVLPVAAQDTLIYRGPVPIKIQGETTNLPIALFASQMPEQSEQIQLHAHTDIGDLRPMLLNQLRKLAKDKIDACELRLSVLDAATHLSQSQIFLTATLQAEIWLCTSLLETAIGSDSFTLEIGVTPDVRAGRLHLTPGSVTAHGMDETVRSIGGELLLQRLVQEGINRFNNNPKLTSLPEKLGTAGYSYHAVTAGNSQIGQNTLRISIIGPNDLVALVSTLANLR